MMMMMTRSTVTLNVHNKVITEMSVRPRDHGASCSIPVPVLYQLYTVQVVPGPMPDLCSIASMIENFEACDFYFLFQVKCY